MPWHFGAISIAESQFSGGNGIYKNSRNQVHHCSNLINLLIDAELNRHQQTREVQT